MTTLVPAGQGIPAIVRCPLCRGKLQQRRAGRWCPRCKGWLRRSVRAGVAVYTLWQGQAW